MEEKSNELIKTELAEIKKLLQDIAKRIDCIEEEIRKEQNEQSSKEPAPHPSDSYDGKSLQIMPEDEEVAKQLELFYDMVDKYQPYLWDLLGIKR